MGLLRRLSGIWESINKLINLIKNLIKNKKSLIFLDQILVSGSNFILGILLARYLGIDLFGKFSLIWIIVLFFSSIQLAFIISPMLTHGAKKVPVIKDYYLSNIFYFQTFFVILCVLVLSIFLTIYSKFSSTNLDGLFIFILFLVYSFLNQDFIRRYLIIKELYFKLLIIDIISYLGQLISIGYLIYENQLTLKNTIISISIVFISSFLLSFLFVRLKSNNKKYMTLIFLKNWKFSKWLVYSSILQWGSGNFFVLTAGYLLGPWAVGVIRIMQNTMGIFHVIFIALENILPIKFAEIYKKFGYLEVWNYFIKQLKFGIILISLIILLLLFSYEKLILLIYGNEYTSYSYLIFGFMILYIFIYIAMLQRYILRTIENTKIIFTNYIYTSIFSLLSSIILIKLLSLNGVVIGMIITQIISNFIFYFEIKKFNRKDYNV